MNTNDQVISSKNRKAPVALGIIAAIVALAGAVVIGVGSASAEQPSVQAAVEDSNLAAGVSGCVASACANYVDADGDGVCDYRGTRGAGGAGCWTDANGDGICDNCGGYVDADGDGVCDNRGSRGSAGCGGYVDADGDGICDNCGSSSCWGGGNRYGQGADAGNGNGYGYGSGNGYGPGDGTGYGAAGGGHHGAHHGAGRAA